jgi:chromosome segregation ATPase
MHGTRHRNVPTSLISDMRAIYPVFEFAHSGGLALVGVGTKQIAPLQHLLEDFEEEVSGKAVSELFARWGLACRDVVLAVEARRRSRELKVSLAERSQSLSRVATDLERARRDQDAHVRELGETRANLERSAQHFAAERGQLTERVATLEEWRRTLEANLTEATQALHEANADNRRMVELRHESELALLERQHQMELLEKSLATVTRDGEEHRRARTESATAAEEARREATSAEISARTLRATVEQITGEIETARAEIERLERELRTSQREIADGRARGLRLEADVAKAEGEVCLAKIQIAELEDQLSRTVAESDVARMEMATLADALLRTKEASALLYTELGQERAALQSTREENTELRRALDECEGERVLLRKALDERVAEIERLDIRQTSREEALGQHAEKFEKLSSDLGHLTRLIERERADFQHERRSLEADLSNASAMFGRIVATVASTVVPWRKAAVLSRWGRYLVEAGLLNPSWYLTNNPDVAAAGVDPVQHYLLYGAAEGRQPRPLR